MSVLYRRPHLRPNSQAALIAVGIVLILVGAISNRPKCAQEDIDAVSQTLSDTEDKGRDSAADNVQDTPSDRQDTCDIEDKSGLAVLGLRDTVLHDPESIYVVVNKSHGIDIDFEPQDLVEVHTYVACENNCLRKQAADAFCEMYEQALKDDVHIGFGSGYRPGRYQQELWEGYRARYGEVRACEISAKGGYSEHQTGLCFDATEHTNSFDGINYTSKFAHTKTGIWLAEHSWEYGFILRYPEGYEDITGYTFEPWHYRYIGKKAAALYHKENATTLEEFFHIQGGTEYK